MNTEIVKQSLTGLVKQQPNQLAVIEPQIGEVDFNAALSLIAGFNGEPEPTKTDIILAKWAVNEFNLTKSDFEYGYREAFKDKYTGSKMTMKHIVAKVEEKREASKASSQKYPFGEVMNWLTKRNLPLDYTPYFDFKPDNTGKWYYLKAEFKDL